MIKKDITFTNYNDEVVTKTYYFNFNKLEGAELEMEYGGLEEKMEELNRTEDSVQAYAIFKDILLRAVGVKSADGNEFVKSPETRSSFENSPALAELIFEFFSDPEKVAPFLEGMLPAKDVAEGKARLERQRLIDQAVAAAKAGEQSVPELETAPAVLEEPVAVAPRTDEEILAANMEDLSNEELARLVELRKASATQL